MKLVVTIPAYNEEKTISDVIKEIRELKPEDFEGRISDIKIVVVNDGSNDNTAKVAKDAGADVVVSFRRNRGLARAFGQGIETALELGADIIVNIDADDQYDAKEIPKLVNPILDGEADIVLGSRFEGWIEYMPPQKRIGNKIATWVTRIVSGFPTSDAQTGFRAFSRDAAMKLHVLGDYTYVQETIIQANQHGLKIVEVPITFRKRKGDGQSRLISNIFGYAKRAGMIILRSYRDYNPLKVFGLIGGVFIAGGLYFGWRVLSYYFATGGVSGRLPSAVLATLLLIVGVQTLVLGLLADMLRSQRMLLDDALYRLKELEYGKERGDKNEKRT